MSRNLSVNRCIEGKVDIVPMNRPDKLNTLNDQTIREPYDIIPKNNGKTEVDFLIMTKEGWLFSASSDAKEYTTMNLPNFTKHQRIGNRLYELNEGVNEPVMATVNIYSRGPYKLKQLLWTDKFLSAEKPPKGGRVSKIAQLSKLLEKMKVFAKSAIGVWFMIGNLKSFINETAAEVLNERDPTEVMLTSLLFNTEGGKDGLRDSLEKRSPRFLVR